MYKLTKTIVALAVTAIAHNYVRCSNARSDLEGLLSDRSRGSIPNMQGSCNGFSHAFPGDDSRDERIQRTRLAVVRYPALDRRSSFEKSSCSQLVSFLRVPSTPVIVVRVDLFSRHSRLQENPVYDPSHPPAQIQPGSTVLVQIQTNNHLHEYLTRPSGHYKIFLAGPSFTQLTTQNQLTFGRCIFSAPSNKYAHVISDPSDDPRYAWLPLKLVDPTGAYLPEGTYNFSELPTRYFVLTQLRFGEIFEFFWATQNAPQTDYMIPDYASSFDIVVNASAEDPGSVTECVTNNLDCAS